MSKFKKILDIKKDWDKRLLSDGAALDELLNILKTFQPTLRAKIINLDGEDYTDADCVEMVFSYYYLNVT